MVHTSNWELIGGPLKLGGDFPLTSVSLRLKITRIITQRILWFGGPQIPAWWILFTIRKRIPCESQGSSYELVLKPKLIPKPE